MSIHLRAYRSSHPILARGQAAKGLVFILGLAIVAVGASFAARPAPTTANDVALQQAVGRALDARTSDRSGRLVRASTTFWGDVAVEFVVRDEGGADVNRAAAMADTLAIARAVYETSLVRPLNVTVLGLAAHPSPALDSVPVLYASLPADRLVGLDWTQARADDPSARAGVRWLPTGVCQAWHECAADTVG